MDLSIKTTTTTKPLDLHTQSVAGTLSATTSSPSDSRRASHSLCGSTTSESLQDSPCDIKPDPDDSADDKPVLSPTSTSDPGEQPPPSQPVKRPRGRPRKHPIVPVNPDAKLNRGRSKTGCITCRRRKKKCDETKPTCVNCQKNSLVCEYKPPVYWQAGRHREGDPNGSLPPLISGVEDEIDRHLLQHFNNRLSQRLCLPNERQSPFNKLIVPMALEDSGLMHSILCLSAFQLAATHATLEKSHGGPDFAAAIQARRDSHFDQAISLLKERNMAATHVCEPDHPDDCAVAQTIILCLITIMSGEHAGEYKMHLDAARHLITCQVSRNPEFQSFVTEFLMYHDVSNSITSLDHRSILSMTDFRLPDFVPPEAGSFLGVLDGLFLCLSQITSLRDKVRSRRALGQQPHVDYETLASATKIDAELREWTCYCEEGTPRHFANLLYRQCSWIYLFRTILPSRPNDRLQQAVDMGLNHLRQLKDMESIQAILLMPIFLLGCACFKTEQRPEILDALDVLQVSRGSGNIKHTRTVINEIWAKIDRGDEDSWDWETVMSQMGLNFLIT